MFASSRYGTLFEVSDRVRTFDQMKINKVEMPEHGNSVRVMAEICVLKPEANPFNIGRNDVELFRCSDVHTRLSVPFVEWYTNFVRGAMADFNKRLEEMEHGTFANRHYTPATIEEYKERMTPQEVDDMQTGKTTPVQRALKRGEFPDSGFNEWGEFNEC